jgi:hypothetical protein
MSEHFGGELWLGSLEQAQARSNFDDHLFEFVISRYSYQALIDTYVPHLEIHSNYDDRQVVPFFGHVLMELSSERYCQNCFSQIEAEDSICESCLKELDLEFLKCVRSGPRFGTGSCDVKDPACKSDFSHHYCSLDHVIYLAAFEDARIKVGMTRKDRLLLRLIEQGASYGTFFQRAEGERDFVSTYDLEQAISRDFGLQQAVVFEEKIEIFKGVQKNLKDQIVKLDALKKLLKEYYQIQALGDVDFRPFFFPVPKFQKIEKDKLRLNGEIIGFRGSVGFIKENGEVVAFDLHKLSGHKLKNVRG